MIKKLQRRMLIMMMSVISIVLITLIALINILPARKTQQETHMYLMKLVEGDELSRRPFRFSGSPHLNPDPSLPPEGQNFSGASYAVGDYNTDGTLLSLRTNRNDLYDEYFMESLGEEFQNNDTGFGTTSGNRYYLQKTNCGFRIALVDNRAADSSGNSLLLLSLLCGFAAEVVFFLLCLYLVRRITAPVREAFQKQRQFISDAGHELKTPVSVIAANADVLSSEIGDNKWLSYIRSETGRMGTLIRNLMTLAEIDDSEKNFIHSELDLSQIVLGSALPFESMAFENNISLETDIEPDICLKGNQEQLEQLTGIFLNNALKYGIPGGRILVSLKKQHHNIRLSVFNTGKGIPPEEEEHIFQRFYRIEKDRNHQTGGYGLGLAIAKSIAEEHRGKISVENHYGESICFHVDFPAESHPGIRI